MDFEYKMSDEDKERLKAILDMGISIDDIENHLSEMLNKKIVDDIEHFLINGDPKSDIKPIGFMGFDEGEDEKTVILKSKINKPTEEDRTLSMQHAICLSGRQISLRDLKKMSNAFKNAGIEIANSMDKIKNAFSGIAFDDLRHELDKIRYNPNIEPDKKVTPANYVHPNQKSKRRNYYKCLKK